MGREQLQLLAARELAAAAPAEGGGTAGEAMAVDPLVVEPEDTLGQISEEMQRRGAGAALVVMAGRLIGVLTSRDLLRAFAGRAHPSEARAREWMTAEPVAVTPETALEAAVTLMTEYGIHHLPVVEDERPVGMLGLRQAVRETRSRPLKVGLGL